MHKKGRSKRVRPTRFQFSAVTPNNAAANPRIELCTYTEAGTMARKSKKQSGKHAIVTESVRVLDVPRPTGDGETEKKVITTEPEIEVRKPATLAQALTEPSVAVVKNKTRVKTTVQKRRVA